MAPSWSSQKLVSAEKYSPDRSAPGLAAVSKTTAQPSRVRAASVSDLIASAWRTGGPSFGRGGERPDLCAWARGCYGWIGGGGSETGGGPSSGNGVPGELRTVWRGPRIARLAEVRPSIPALRQRGVDCLLKIAL